jgi:hypothetical protein
MEAEEIKQKTIEVKETTWRKFRARAAGDGLSVAAALEEALQLWVTTAKAGRPA